MLTKNQILSILKQYKNEHFKDYGIKKMGIFGSVSRNEIKETSDVDVVVELEKPNLFILSIIRLELEEQLHNHVDIVRLRDKMNLFLKEQIKKEAIYV